MEGANFWIFFRKSMTIQSSGQTIASLSYIEDFTLGAVEEINEVAGRADVMFRWDR